MLDGDPLSTTIGLVILLALQVISTMGEEAAELLSESRLKRLSEAGGKGLSALTKLSRTDYQLRFTSFRCGAFISGTLATVLWFDALYPWLNGLFQGLHPVASAVCSAAILLLAGAFVALTACDVARRIFLQRADTALLSGAGLLVMSLFVFSPIYYLVTGSLLLIASVCIRAFGYA